MHIIIVGCGNVGKTITAHLSKEGHNVVVVDKKAEVVNAVADSYDVMGVVGNGASLTTLMEAGLEAADLLIAVANSDELNLLCCVIAKKAGNCQTIARIGNPAYSSELEFIREAMGISLIVNTKLAVAYEIARLIKYPSALQTYSFAKERVELVKIPVKGDSVLCNCALKDLHNKMSAEAFICIVERGKEVIIPDGDFIIKEKDLISAIIPANQINLFFKEIGYSKSPIKDVMIVGGGKTTVYLGKMLDAMGIKVTVIEKNRDRCEELCELLPNACIVNGDGTDKDLLIEEEIEKTGAFVAWTDFDEENIMLSLYAKTASNAKVVTQIHRINYDDMIHTLDIGSILYPKNLTGEFIVRYVRAMSKTIGSNVETLYNLIDGMVEALEFNVRDEIEGLVNIPLSQLRLKDNILIAGIQHDGKMIIPKGSDTIQKGDSVIVVTTTSGFTELADILV